MVEVIREVGAAICVCLIGIMCMVPFIIAAINANTNAKIERRKDQSNG